MKPNIVRDKTLSCLLVAFAALAAVQMAQADANWRSEKVGGSEESPYDIWDETNWDGSIGPANKLYLSVSGKTYIKSESDAQIANWFMPYAGDFTFIGPINVSVFGWTSPSGTATIIKKGDWTVGYEFDIAHEDNSYVAITNVSGNVSNLATGSGNSLRIGAGQNSAAIIENISGDWASGQNFLLGYGTGSRGEFILDGGSLTVTNNLTVGNGDGATGKLAINGGTVTCSTHGCVLIAGNGENSTGTIEMNDGSVSCYHVRLGIGSGSEGVFTINGGSLTARQDLNVGHGSSSTGMLTINDGSVACNHGGDFVFNVAYGQNSVGTVVLNDGSVSCKYLRLGGNSGAKGVFTMNGGTLTVSNVKNNHFSIGYANGATGGEFNLNGGTVTAIGISSIGTGTLNFNGGTLKAKESGTLIADSANLTVTVGENGGTIDSNNKAITIAKAIGGTGVMTYKGGNAITLSAVAGNTCGTIIEGGTCINVANRSAATALIDNALKVTLPAAQLASGAYALLTITGEEAEDVFTAEDLAKVKFTSGVNGTGVYLFALSDDSKSILLWAPHRGEINSTEVAKLVFPCRKLTDLATHTLRARLGGAWTAARGAELTFFYRQAANDAVTYQLQTLDSANDGNYAKCVMVEFTEGVDGVYVKLKPNDDGKFTNYSTSQSDFGTEPITKNPATSQYYPYDFRIVAPVTNSINVNFTYNGNNLASSDVRYGGGDYAVPYSAWENMAAANGSATIDGATWTISNGAGAQAATSLSATKDLRHGFIGDSDTYTTPTVTVENVPYDAYRVVVYGGTHDNATFGHVTVNGRNYTAEGTPLSGDYTATTAEGDSAWGKNSYKTGNCAYGIQEGLNYLVSYVTGGKTATITGHRGGEGTVRGGIAAIQIVKVDALNDGDIFPLKVINGTLERTSMSLVLPTEGTATVNIYGGSLNVGDYVIFTDVAADALNHLTVNIAPEVLASHKYSLNVADGNLVLNIASPGMLFIVH